MSKNAEIHIKKYYLVAKNLYPPIVDEFYEIEEGKKLNVVQLERFNEKIKRALALLKQIDTSAIGAVISSNKQKEIIEDNIAYMYEEILNIKKRLEVDEYVENLWVPVRRYIKQMKEDPSNYKKWAKDEEQLTGKFIGMITNPDNFDMYKNHIKRMALGTMNLKEFKKIFNAAKHKMIPLPEYTFESFREYKKYKKL